MNVTYAASSQATLTTGLTAGNYVYRYSFSAADGSESAVSSMLNAGVEAVVTVNTIAGVASGQVVISNLPVTQPNLTLRIYRASIFGGVPSTFRYIGSVASGTSTFTDRNVPVVINPIATPRRRNGSTFVCSDAYAGPKSHDTERDFRRNLLVSIRIRGHSKRCYEPKCCRSCSR